MDTCQVQALLFVDDTFLVMKTEEDCKHNMKSTTMTTTTTEKMTVKMTVYSMHQKSLPAAAALIHSCVLSAAEVVLKLVKPLAHTNKPPEAPPKAEPNLLTMLFLSLHRSQLKDRRGFSGQEGPTMKIFVVVLGLITATLVSSKSGAREEGRESWDKE